LQIILF